MKKQGKSYHSIFRENSLSIRKKFPLAWIRKII